MTSISVTERIKLWNQFTEPLDHETVKSDFLRRIHCKNPPFRFKLKTKQRNCAEIPPMVEFHYKNPPPLLPSLRDVLRCERVYRERGLPEITAEPDVAYVDLEKDLQNANEKVREFESSISREDEANDEKTHVENNEEGHIENNEEEHIENIEIANEEQSSTNNVESEEFSGIVEALGEKEIPMRTDEKKIEKIENHTQIIEEIKPATESETCSNDNDNSNGDADNINNKLRMNRKRKRNVSAKSFGVECDDLLELSEEVFKSKLENEETDIIQSPETISEQLNGLDIDVIKRLAFAQLQQILKDSPDLVAKYQNESANKAIKDALKEKPAKIKLPSQLLTKDDIARIAEQYTHSLTGSENENCVTDKAYAGVTHPIPPLPSVDDEYFFYTNGLESIDDDKERALAIAQRLEKPLQESKIRARAVLTPVGDILAGKRWYTNTCIDNGIFMRYRSLVVGSGPGCDFQLKSSRKCARFSPHHATIYYDEVSIESFSPTISVIFK